MFLQEGTKYENVASTYFYSKGRIIIFNLLLFSILVTSNASVYMQTYIFRHDVTSKSYCPIVSYQAASKNMSIRHVPSSNLLFLNEKITKITPKKIAVLDLELAIF